jgi:glycerol-3-phosphate dehydrogenase
VSRGVYDVAIIGAGNVGGAIARELARYELEVVLLEAAADVGAGTSKANTALAHTGFDAKPDTREAEMVARGHRLLHEYAEAVGIPLEPVGALLVAWSEEELASFPEIRRNAERCGYRAIAEVSREELYAREPNLGPGARGALSIPDEHVVCPFTPVLAYVRQAIAAGVELRRDERVSALTRRPGGGWRLETKRGALESRWIVNAAGLYSDELHEWAGYSGFRIAPRKGELIVFDKLSRPLVDHILLPVPGRTSKGMIVSPTVFGNVVAGPTAEDVSSREDLETSAAGLSAVRDHVGRVVPRLLDYELTAAYAGLRAATEHDDYVLEVDGESGYACAAGIRSTGLTSAMAIAEHLVGEIGEAGLPLRGEGALPVIRMPNIGENGLRPFADQRLIERDPEYGRIVCFCERVTAGEVRDALGGPTPAVDAGGLARRTRAMLGRCQGFYCGARLAEMIDHAGPGER